jgi:anti-sigma B factor antagonist
MKDFRIDQETRGPVQIVRLAGTLDMYSFPRLESQLNALFQQGRYSLVLDCRDLDYIGDAGLGALIGYAKQTREHDGDLRLLNVPERIYKTIEALDVTKALRVHQIEDDAIASFQVK